jgi:predicted dehydrogenase
MTKHRVAQVGCGERGKIHLDGWLANPDRFEVVALCDLDEAKMAEVARERGLSAPLFTDAEAMMAEARPDVFCFSTQPDVRLPMVELAVSHEVKGLVFEKPMATSLQEAWDITHLCREHRIKAAVSHQQKYVTSFQKLKAMVDRSAVGAVERMDVSCRGWLLQLGTHFADYLLWANGGSPARWVVGHIHGRGRLTDPHPSPDYVMGQIAFENGVRSWVEFGTLSPVRRHEEAFWMDSRLTVSGTHGYVWCDTDGRWGAFTPATKGEVEEEVGDDWAIQEPTRLQPLFARDLADWLDDDSRIHPCNLDISYHGFEIVTALCLSALDHCRVDLPLEPGTGPDIFARMSRDLPECSGP